MGTNDTDENEPDSGTSESEADSETVTEAIQLAERVLPGIEAAEGESDPRWQAIIEVGAYVESDPEAVWEFTVRWGKYDDDDLRGAIATCVLEHLLQYYFDLLFPRVEELARESKLFAGTFCSCWKFGQSELPHNAARFDELKREFGCGPSP